MIQQGSFRGTRLVAGSYLFNIVRYVIPHLIRVLTSAEGVLAADVSVEQMLYLIFQVDILTFAGLAFLLTGFLKKWKVSVWGVLVIAMLMQAAGVGLNSLYNSNSLVLSYLLAPFIKSGYMSYFPLFQWYVYPAFGLVFAKYLRHIENTDKLYGGLLAVSAALMASFCAALLMIGYDIRKFFALVDDTYYMQTCLHTIFALLCIMLELSVVHFIMKLIHAPKWEAINKYMSKNLNKIYIVQWTVIGWVGYLVLRPNKTTPAYATIPIGLALTALSVLAVKLYELCRGKLKGGTPEKP